MKKVSFIAISVLSVVLLSSPVKADTPLIKLNELVEKQLTELPASLKKQAQEALEKTARELLPAFSQQHKEPVESVTEVAVVNKERS